MKGLRDLRHLINVIHDLSTLGPVKLIPCRACDQRMRFAAVVEITEHIAPHIVSFLLWIAKQPVNGREGCWSVLSARAIQHMGNCTRQ